MTLAPLDILVIALFTGLLLALGFSAKLKDNSVLQYLVAGRRLTLPMFVCTLVCTWYGGILGVGESVAFYGMGALLMIGVPYYIFGLFFAWRLAHKVRAAEEISIPERLERQFGRSVGLASATLIFFLAIPSAHVLMLGIMVQMLTGWSLGNSVLVSALVGSLFLFRGGILADVRASMLAFVMMYAGFLVMVVVCLSRLSWPEMVSRLSPPSLATATGGQSWPMILSFLILGAWTLVDPGFHQRAASAESVEVSRRGVTMSVGLWFFFDLLSISTGLYALALLPSQPANALMVFPALAQLVLPAGIKGLFLCGIVGTVMCAMVGYALVAGATLGREILGRVKVGASDPQIKKWTLFGIPIGLALASAIGTQVASVVALWYSLGGIVTGALLLPLLLAYLRTDWRPAKGVVLLALVASSAVSLGWWIYAASRGNPYMVVELGGASFSLGTLLPALVISALVLGLGSLANTKEKIHG